MRLGGGGGGGRFDTLPTAHISREQVGSCDALTGFRLRHNHPPSHSNRGTTAHVHFSHSREPDTGRVELFSVCSESDILRDNNNNNNNNIIIITI